MQSQLTSKAYIFNSPFTLFSPKDSNLMLSLLLKPLPLNPCTIGLKRCTTVNRFVVRTMSSGRMFQLKFDPLTGDSEWVVIEESEGLEEKQEPLLATTSYLDMLNDSLRNKAYREAIDKTVTHPCHVLDIGAGTGLLSMMAARAMGRHDSSTSSSSQGKVSACESYLPMVKLMRRVLRANGLEKKIQVINKRSDELKVGEDISSRADVLVSEILDSEFLGEGLIPTLQHAHDNLLVENPQSVPYKATTYGQLVESLNLRKLHDLFNNESNISDGIFLSPKGVDSVLQIKQKQFSMHCDAMKEEIKLLSEPFEVFDFEFWKRPDSYRETELHIKATDDGTVHAIVSWWLLQLDSEGTIFYCTGPKWASRHFPGIGDWCDHWKQCVWFLPEKGLPVYNNQDIDLAASHNETSISYKVKNQLEEKDGEHRDHSSLSNQILLSPERLAIYGDGAWRSSIINAINNSLQKKVSPMCLIVDDGLFLAAAVAKVCKSSHVIALFPGLRQRGAYHLQAIASANSYSKNCVEVMRSRKQHLTLQDTHQRKVDILLGEPFYYGNENMLPWQNLRFWKERTLLDSILSEDVLIMPRKGILRACAMSLPDLWRSRRCLDKIEGFDHTLVNSTLGACGDLPENDEVPCLPFSTWQCGESKKLSNIACIMEFDFLKPITSCAGKAKVDFIESGICHGFVLWIDWVLDSATEISTGPDQRYWKQGVKLLKNPKTAGRQELGHVDCEIEASFDPTSGDLTIKHSFS